MSSSLLKTSLRKLEKAQANAVRYILACQKDTGALPWFANGKLDPWDHCESLMALTLGGHHQHWQKGFEWLQQQQLANGSWYASYFNTNNDNDARKIESNFVAYPATALWHHYLCTGERNSLQQFFPLVQKAIHYVCSQQSAEGDIQWAVSECETLPRDALLTACSSILRSLECAIHCAETLDIPCEDWRQAYRKLYDTLKNKPWRFDRSWESKERFSMDWFYPILAGIYSPEEARIRLHKRWDIFVENGVGCRCVSDEPWMTVAESSELCLALIASEQQDKATEILLQLVRWQDDDGGFWTGYNFRDDNIWPREKTSWTAAAFVLACDALFQKSPATDLFTRVSAIV